MPILNLNCQRFPFLVSVVSSFLKEESVLILIIHLRSLKDFKMETCSRLMTAIFIRKFFISHINKNGPMSVSFDFD